MRKSAKFMGIVLLFLAFTFSAVQYKNSIVLKENLGGLYRANIMNYKLHVLQSAEYLDNEMEFKENDLRNLYYKANMLMAIELPDKNVITLYETQILHRIKELENLVSGNNSSEKIKTAKNDALQLLRSLESSLVDMLNAGIVQNKDGSMREDSKAYYDLSLPDNKIMKSINKNLEKASEGFYTNP